MWKLLLCINSIRCMTRSRSIFLSFKDECSIRGLYFSEMVPRPWDQAVSRTCTLSEGSAPADWSSRSPPPAHSLSTPPRSPETRHSAISSNTRTRSTTMCHLMFSSNRQGLTAQQCATSCSVPIDKDSQHNNVPPHVHFQ